jgi:hypothetical protein
MPFGSPHAAPNQALSAAEVRDVQVMPSALVMTRSPVPVEANAAKPVLPYVRTHQSLSAAEVRVVQVMPSALVMTRLPVPVEATATKRPTPPGVPYLTPYQ